MRWKPEAISPGLSFMNPWNTIVPNTIPPLQVHNPYHRENGASPTAREVHS